MATSKAKRHTHKYHQVELEPGNKIWACGLPNCNHHMPKHYSKLVEGKNSICWNCGDEFELDQQLMKEDRPICRECKNDPLIEYFDEHATSLERLK